MKPLHNKIALVTGASRGVGKGIALGLGEAGATVYITGRTVAEGTAPSKMPGTIQRTAHEVDEIGGHGIAVQCDHTDDGQTRAVFERIMEERGRLDILVNNVWGGYEHYTDGTEFWSEEGFWSAPTSRWDSMFRSGVRAHYVASSFAAPIMIDQRSGLIVNISFFAAQRDDHGVAYGVAKAASDRMAACMAHELRPYNVAAISLYPGLVRTDSVLKAGFDLSNSESPQFIGRAVAALSGDPDIIARSGRVFIAASVALEYGFTDVDGNQPQPLTAEAL